MIYRVLGIVGILASSCAFGQVAKTTTSQETVVWNGYGGDPQHSAQSKYPLSDIGEVAWSACLDFAPPYSGDVLFTHYGEVALTTNTAIIPQRLATGRYNFTGFNISNGSTSWSYLSTYVLPPSSMWGGWTPPVSGTLLPNGSYVGPAAGGGVFMRPHVDSPNLLTTIFHKCGSLAYSQQSATYNSNLYVCTPITSDAAGSVYYGVHTTGTLPDGTQNGWIKMTVNGTFSMYTSDSGYWPEMNAGPALSPDGSTVYVVESQTGSSVGQIVALNAATMQKITETTLIDPQKLGQATIFTVSSASPLVGPDGDVYYGVFDQDGGDRGWLLHFDSSLNPKGVPGGFGWDDTPSVVPASAIPSYTGSAKYLLFCKYNNYYGYDGGNGRNMVAVVDPTTATTDPFVNTVQIMNPVIEVLGPTADDRFPNSSPQAVREWCINSAAVDAAGKCIAVNSEDGNAYKLDLTTGTLTIKVSLTAGIGEAYTPTAIGADGTMYAVSNARLYALRPKPVKVKVAKVAREIPLHPVTDAPWLAESR